MIDKKYAEIIGKIKELQPSISDPQKLTSKTMNSIELLSKKKNHSQMLTIISWISSIAASFLVGLFLFEYFLSYENVEYKNSKISTNYYIPVYEINMDNERSIGWSEINQIILHKNDRQKKLLSFYSNLINKHKTL
jgi:hypothetical protein